jgi:hypothetical protein
MTTPMDPDDYLRAVEQSLSGGRGGRRRLLTELRDHLDDSLDARSDVEDVMARVGSPEEVTTPWREHVTAIRRQNRRRAALLALTVATAGALGIAQHASGHRAPHVECSAALDRAHAHHCDGVGAAPLSSDGRSLAR